MKRTRFGLAGLLVLLCSSVLGAEVAGVKIAETAKSGATDMVLNGAGLRTKVFFKVYAMGLYLPAKKGVVADVLAAAGPKRVEIHMLRDVNAPEFSEALKDGLRNNHSEAEFKALGPRLEVLTGSMNEMKEAKTGMVILLDWIPGVGTRITIDNQVRGKPIPGEDFYRALLRIWLGEDPVSSDLKKALLGQEG